jgi:metal-sulfur cluster biosynthetic enzyme
MSAKVEDVTEAMKDVVDPELGINVVDLGLIYDVMVDESNIAILNMTLISDDGREQLRALGFTV